MGEDRGGGDELLLSTMACPPAEDFPSGSVVAVGCSLKQLRRVQGPLHYTPLLAALFSTCGGCKEMQNGSPRPAPTGTQEILSAPRGVVVRHSGDYTLVRFRHLPSTGATAVVNTNTSGAAGFVTRRGLWPSHDSPYHPLNTVLSPHQRATLMDTLDENMCHTRSLRHEDALNSTHNSSKYAAGLLDVASDDDDREGGVAVPDFLPGMESATMAPLPAPLSNSQRDRFLEEWSANRAQRQRLRDAIVRHRQQLLEQPESEEYVTCEFSLHRSCLTKLIPAA